MRSAAELERAAPAAVRRSGLANRYESGELFLRCGDLLNRRSPLFDTLNEMRAEGVALYVNCSHPVVLPVGARQPRHADREARRRPRWHAW